MIEIQGYKVRELRCGKCRKLIAYENNIKGVLIYICPRCGETNIFRFFSLNKFKESHKIRGLQIKNTKGGEI